MASAAAIATGDGKPEYFRAPASVWWQAAAFLLLMSFVGLQLYPLLLLVIVFIIWRWRQDRYSLMVEMIIFIGAFGFMPSSALPIPASDFGLAAGIVGIIIYRKNRDVKRVTLAMAAYFAVVILIAMTSLETMSVQMYRMRRYFTIVVYFIPLLIFVNRAFEWKRFMEATVVHALVICGFYVIDTFIIGGFILVPGASFGEPSTIFEPIIYGPLSLPRHYPPGLYWLIPCVIWINYKQLRFSPLQWVVIALALFASRTNSMLFALVVCWIFFRPNIKQVIVYSIIGTVVLIGGYFIDSATGRHLRLADNFDQFTSLESAEQDPEKLAEFGSGRMAQIIPKWELLEELDRVALGFGFIHPEKTTNPIFQIHNYLYVDQSSEADEVATEVEVTQVQTVFDIGIVGALVQLAFFVGVYFIIRRLKHARDYLNVIVGTSVLGIGGFAGFNGPHGLCLIGTILSAILLVNKPLSLKQAIQNATDER